jgi:hypothetical protein
MRYEKYLSRPLTLTLFAATALTGCDSAPTPRGDPQHASIYRASRDRYEVTGRDSTPYAALLKAHEQGEQRALRIKIDAVRNRLWVLGLNHVYIYDITGKQLVRRVALPNGSVAGFVCPPDMALNLSGAAIVAGNVESTLWKIDPEDFSIKAQDITLQADVNRSIGFGALTFAADGSLYAISAHEGLLWRIDFATLRGNEVALSERLLNTCSLKASQAHIQSGLARSAVLCAATGKNVRTIVISPDFARGHVSTEPCPS